MDLILLKGLFLSLFLGFLIGLERNISFKIENEKSFAGSRTFSLISLFGYISAFLTDKLFSNFIYISFLSVSFLIITAYFLKVFHYNKQGSTTHISAFLTFLLGILVYFNYHLFAIVTTIIIVTVLNLKPMFKNIESRLSSKDINAAILLLGMSFLILPYLPDKMIYFINPYKTWLMAIIISFLSFLGYLGIKIFGEKYGILITGAAGGFVSSTAVTYSLSKLYSKLSNQKAIFTYASAIAIANTIMFARVLVEAGLINKEILKLLFLPYTLTTLLGIYLSYRLYKKAPNEKINTNFIEKNPLSLEEAIKFAIIFAVIYAIVHIIGNKYGNIGIYLISLISGITDVDAITLSLSSLSKQDLSLINASIGIALATISNTLFKLSIVWFFSKKDLAKTLTRFFTILLVFFILILILTLFVKIYVYTS